MGHTSSAKMCTNREKIEFQILSNGKTLASLEIGNSKLVSIRSVAD